MTRLIGVRCKAGNRLSRDILIARILLGNLEASASWASHKGLALSVLLNEIN